MRHWLLGLALAALFGLSPSFASAQSAWPSRPIRLVVPFAAGGNTDAVARVTAEYMQAALGTNVFVENRGGAGGIVGTDVVAKAEPDGYTLCVCSIGSITIAPSLEKLPYDPLADLEPISPLSTNALAIIATPALAANTVDDLVRLAKAKPKGIDYGSSGIGGLMHISALLFQQRTGTEMTHVPYRGGAPAVLALIAGQVGLVFANMSDALPQIDGKQVKALAVTTRTRNPQIPDVPTLAESGFDGFHVESWNALFAPKGTPKEIVERLGAVAAAMAADPAVKRRMAGFASETAASPPEAFRRDLQAETTQWRELLQRVGLAKAS